jgi:hypothetical protein
MKNTKLKTNLPLTIFSWLVKSAGIVMFLLIAIIFVGEGPPNPMKISSWELLLFIALLVTLTGCVAALRWQIIGGISIAAGMGAFLGELRNWVFWAFAAIGILHILCGILKKIYEGKVTGAMEKENK